MSFGHPWLLLVLLVVPLALGLHRLAERRRVRYAGRFTNGHVLAPGAGRPSRRLAGPAALGDDQIEGSAVHPQRGVIVLRDLDVVPDQRPAEPV